MDILEILGIEAAIVGVLLTMIGLVINWARGKEKERLDRETQLHTRVSNLKDIVSALEGDFKALQARIDGIDGKLTDHDARDIEDFNRLSDKVEKIMEIIVEMLRDDPK